MWVKYIFSILVVNGFFISGSLWLKAGPAENYTARRLFDQSLAADSAGDDHLRRQLLQRALEIDPDFELARWHLGQVFFRGYWRPLETVGTIVTHHPRWKEYRELLESSDESTDAHMWLARWCQRNGLEHEEKWHWQQVLQAVPDHPQALKNLGMKSYQGGYYTSAEILELKQLEDQAERALKSFRRRFRKLVNEAYRGDESVRAKRLGDLAAVSDPTAVEALYEVVVSVTRKNNTAAVSAEYTFEEQVGSAVVAALTNIEQHPATLRLLDIAVFAPQSYLRRLAAEGLRYREPTGYMPLLMANLSAPLESSFSVNILPDGKVNLVEEIFVEGPEKGSRELRDVSYATHRQGTRRVAESDETFTMWVPDTKTDLRKANARIASTRAKITQENFARVKRNSRIREVLENVTGQQLGDDPRDWWTAWKQYNEIYTPEQLPVEEKYNQEYYPVYVRPCECFVAGTPVWTQGGPVPIEQIQVGDLVLSQDPISGRLDYRPVVTTTLRPPTKMAKLMIGNETITATLGHRFWVTGQGWQMAKFLSSGNVLFSVRGSIDLESIEETEESSAYNLVVDGYHSFFVGKSRLLVHDSTCPRPTTAVMPGVYAGGARGIADR